MVNYSTFINSQTYQDDGYVDFRVNNDKGFITYVTFDLLDENLPTTFSNSNYVFIMNCAYINQNGIVQNNGSGQSVYLCEGATTYSRINKSTYLNNYITKNNISYKCVVQGLDQNTNFSTTSGKITIGYRGSQFQSSDTNWQGIRIYNIDILSSDELYTSNYIEDIESQYNQLLNDYEQLEDDYFNLNNDYTQLENDYNTLETDYADLQDSYESITNSQLNQAFINSFNNAQIQVIDYLSGDGVVYTSTISNFNKPYYNLEIDTPDIYSFITNYINQGVRIKITLTTAYNTPINIQFSTYGGEARLFKYINTVYNEPISGVEINNQGAYTLNTTNKTFDIIEIDEPFERQANVIISSTSLGEQYQKGYIDGLNTKDNDVYNLNNQIRNLTNQLTTQQQTINALNEQIEDFSSDYNLNNLMWTIASTPFESFKQIWNLNFMGVNLSNLFFGMISTLIGLYIVKKFFL